MALRPKQWVKNLLVLAAPGAAGVLGESEAISQAAIAFVAFCLASSATYLINDSNDIEADRLHPKKRFRPIAAGEISVSSARLVAAGLALAALVLGFLVQPEFVVVVAAYMALTTAYSVVLKHVVLLDVIVLASGFVLRAIAGAAATSVPISDWFFIVTSFGSLFIAVGKRHSEVIAMGSDAGTHRRVLDEYSPEFLGYLRSVTSGVMVVAYCLWAFERSALTNGGVPWYQISIVPFVVAVFRYAQLVEEGEGSAPEELLTRDWLLASAAIVWAVLFGTGVLAT